MARITEENILRGKLTDSVSRLKQAVSKLGEYEGDAEMLYHHDEAGTGILGFAKAKSGE